MNAIAKLIAERLRDGLRGKSLTTCSRWAEARRIMGGDSFPGPWRFKYHPWLRAMHDSAAELNVGQKSAQVGYTEWALNTALYNIDVKNRDVLYVLPAKTPDAGDFSGSRFDPALELSPHLSNLFSDVKNVGHKRAGTANLYIRGSRARAGLKSVPVGLIILDEVDEMTQKNIPLALERTSGQLEKQVLMISTPTIPGVGINEYFLTTTQEHFFFKCPCCTRITELTFPECLEITAEEVVDLRINDSFIKCKECKNRLEHKTKYEWLANGVHVAEFPNRDARGFHINQLYSSTVKPAALAIAYLKSLHDPADEQEFHNSKLGKPHIVAGAVITEDDINNCKQGYKNAVGRAAVGSTIITMGVDVGKWLHVEIDSWQFNERHSTDLNIDATPKLLLQATFQHFEELDRLMYEYGVHICVIDANPERRKAYEFACRFWGHVKICIYGRGINGKQIHATKDKTQNIQDEHTIQVDRTSWLDLSLGRFKRKGIIIPFDINEEYKAHIKALVRVYEKDKDNNNVGRYVNGSTDDHYAHARNYAEIALPFAASISNPQNITSSPV